MNSIGGKIRELREKHNLTAKELAERLNISPSTLSKLENDKKSIDAVEIEGLSNIFSVTADEILGIQNKRNIVLYMQRDKNLSNDEISEIQNIFDRMDEAITLNEMKRHIQKGKMYVR